MRKRLCTYFMLLLTMVFCISFTMETKAATKYYSASQVKVPKTKSGSPKYIKITKIKGNTVSYRVATEIYSWDGVDYKYSKVKTAKLNSSTKYYIGDAKRFNYRAGGSWYSNSSKWIGKVNKSTFVKKRSQYNDSAIVIKNGKVLRIFSKISVAG